MVGWCSSSQSEGRDVSFFRRLLGRPEPTREAERSARTWFDIPPRGTFEIAGVANHRDELARLFPPTVGEPDRLSAVAVLVRELDNPYDENAVAVQFEQRTIGYIPAAVAPGWAAFLDRLDAEGYRARVTASVWVGEHAWFVRLLAHADADYLTPAAEGQAARERSAVEAAKAATRATTRAAAAETEPRARETSPRLCRDCGKPIEHIPGQRGRPSVRCLACRSGSSARVALSPPAIAPASNAPPPIPLIPAPTVPPAGSVPWVPLVRPAAWAVIDVETTGTYASVDRIVEIAVVRLGPDGDEMDAWTTMLDPARDMGAVEIHGIRASDVRGAPTFGDIAPELLARIGGARLAAHNARFDIDFVDAGMRRAGLAWTKPDAFCTMAVPYRVGVVGSRRLGACCAELGIPYEVAHTALSDARASAAILAFTIDHARKGFPLPDPAPVWPDPEWRMPARLRTDPPPPRLDTTLGQLADRVGVPADVDASDEAALAYLSLLDIVVEDRVVTEPEIAALADTARRWGIGAAAAASLHRSYMAEMWELARADGVVTANELHDLRLLSELLDVPAGREPDASPALVVLRQESFAGLSVCFTGGSVCTIGGAHLSREDQEALASDRGLIVKPSVSKHLDLLVLADPDSRSGKAGRAAELHVRRIAEPAFWRAIGVEID